jgi:hypothetical protein
MSPLVKAAQKSPGDAVMTQLIGAICEDNKKALTFSDRMVSTGDMTLAFEQPAKKVVPVSDKALVLTAGTIHEPDLIRQATIRAKGKERIVEIADVLKEVYQQFREEHIVDEILRALAGIRSFAEWHAKQRTMHDGLAMDLNARIGQYRLGLSLLLVGVDETAHLIRVDDPGTYRSFDNLSYCCIGMGDRHADNVFAWYKYSSTFRNTSAV